MNRERQKAIAVTLRPQVVAWLLDMAACRTQGRALEAQQLHRSIGHRLHQYGSGLTA